MSATQMIEFDQGRVQKLLADGFLLRICRPGYGTYDFLYHPVRQSTDPIVVSHDVAVVCVKSLALVEVTRGTSSIVYSVI